MNLADLATGLSKLSAAQRQRLMQALDGGAGEGVIADKIKRKAAEFVEASKDKKASLSVDAAVAAAWLARADLLEIHVMTEKPAHKILPPAPMPVREQSTPRAPSRYRTEEGSR